MEAGELAEGPEVSEPGEEPSLGRMPLRTMARMLLGLTVMVGLVGGLHYYIGARLIGGLGLEGVARAAGWALMSALFLSIPAGMLGRGLKVAWLRGALRWVAYLWLGGFAVLLSALAATDLAGWLGKLLAGHPLEIAGQSYERWQAMLVSGFVGPALVYGYLRATGRPGIERVQVAIKGLGQGLERLRIVQLSDLHVGETIGREWLAKVVEQVNALEPDVVAITGDLVDGGVLAMHDEVAPLAGLKATLGSFYVTGNHESYHGAAGWEAMVARLGITVLHNEHRVVEKGGDRLVIAGVTDHDGGSVDPQQESRPDLAFAGAPQGVPRVMLAHQPRSAFAAAEYQVDLQLSGHTHAGQIFPWRYFVRLQQPVIEGLQRVAGITVYTNRGTGYWGPPIRLGAPPEITLIELAAG